MIFYKNDMNTLQINQIVGIQFITNKYNTSHSPHYIGSNRVNSKDYRKGLSVIPHLVNPSDDDHIDKHK